MTNPTPSALPAPELAVVVPVKDEAENILPLIAEIDAALAGRIAHEIVYVDDGSGDATPGRLAEARQRFPQLRVIRHSESCGQSAAVATGVRAARAPWIATLDGDGQNDPADIPALMERARAAEAPVLVAGQRVKRRDSGLKRLSSRLANGVRNALLKDGVPDTGCGLKVFRRDDFLALPYFDHIHRFLPALMIRLGRRVVLVPVNHRPRTRGVSKYGVLNRVFVGITDILGVRWLQRRYRRPGSITEA
ncbi:MAG: glycosyltransferase family 2 protein [Alphaproteobacteria bacterium]|nr:glycosyltransferase family 2 protein [Alphaproteobacteria bacterium]